MQLMTDRPTDRPTDDRDAGTKCEVRTNDENVDSGGTEGLLHLAGKSQMIR